MKLKSKKISSVKKIKIRIARIDPGKKDITLPAYSTQGSSGVDLCAAPDADVVVKRGEIALIPTGLKLSIPAGYEGQVRPRSGLALKNGIALLNAPGTIDSDYRGELKIILANFGKEDFRIRRGDRIAQLIISPVVQAEWVEVDSLDDTPRGTGGFGHTGR